MKPFCLILIPSLLLSSSRMATAGEVETKVADAFFKTYVQEQVKARVADFINKNPQVVFSSSSSAGSSGMVILGKLLAAYNLFTAKTDGERAWAAATLLLSPEPTTCAVLLAAQLTETFLALRAQKQLAEEYEEIARIQAETVKIISSIAIERYKSMYEHVQRYSDSLKRVTTLQVELRDEKLFKIAVGSETTSKASADDISRALSKLADLREALNDLDVAVYSLSRVDAADISSLGLDEAIVSSAVKMNLEFDSLRKKTDELKVDFYRFFGSVNASKFLSEIKRDLQPYATKLRTYNYCVGIINKSDLINDAVAMKDCSRRFQNWTN